MAAILSLDVFEPRYVAIGPPGAKVEYELAHPGALSLVESGRLARLMQRRNALIQEMQGKPDAAKPLGWSDDSEQQEERERELSGLVHDLVRMCLRAPESVIRQLGDEAKGAILQAFTQPQPGTTAQPAGAVAAPPEKRRGRRGLPPTQIPTAATSTGESGSPA